MENNLEQNTYFRIKTETPITTTKTTTPITKKKV